MYSALCVHSNDQLDTFWSSTWLFCSGSIDKSSPLLCHTRLGLGVITILLVSIIIFTGVEVLPGDACTAYLEREAKGELLEICREKLGLNTPAIERYLSWSYNALFGDLGYSLSGQQNTYGFQTFFQKFREDVGSFWYLQPACCGSACRFFFSSKNIFFEKGHMALPKIQKTYFCKQINLSFYFPGSLWSAQSMLRWFNTLLEDTA